MLSKSYPKLGVAPLALALAATACSKEVQKNDVTSIGLPTIQLPEAKFDFGQVPEGGKLSHVFTVRNVGAGVLHINQVQTSCGCTAAVSKNKEIPPGGEGQIEVTFDTNHRGGDQHKTIGVMSDDPIKPTVNLEFHANVQVALGLEQEFVQLRAEPGKQQSVESWLTGTSKDKAHLKLLDLPSDHEVTVKLAEKTMEGGAIAHGLRLTLLSKKSGNGSGHVSVETGLASPDKLQLGYSWTVAGNIELSPPEVFFTDAPGDAPDHVVHVSGKNPGFQLRQVHVVSGPFVARFESLDAGTGYDVHVSLKKGAKVPSKAVTELGKLELVSNDSLEPRKEVKLKLAPSFAPVDEHKGGHPVPPAPHAH